MPIPYTARVDVRRFLNFPGFYGGGYVVAYVEDTCRREVGKSGSDHVIPRPRIILELADCSDRISLEFDLDSEPRVENSLHKVDTLIGALEEFRAGLVEEARLYRERAREVEQVERS